MRFRPGKGWCFMGSPCCWRRGLTWVALVLVFPGWALAQVPNPDDDEAEGSGSAILFGDSVPAADTTRPAKEVRIKTLVLDPEAMRAARPGAERLHHDLHQVLYFDRIDRLEGHVAQLGQIGKPYQRFRYGLNTSLFQRELPVNPYTGQEDVYLFDQERDVEYFDTRTPYINAHYGQGKTDLSALEVDVSQNINPWWNLSGMFRRDKATGSYSEFVTDHYQLYLATNVRSRSNRYHLFFNVAFQELSDQLNGGVSQRFAYDDLFGKGSQPVALQDAQLRRLQRGLHLSHFYTLTTDSANNPHTLRVFNSVTRGSFRNQFTDTGIDTTVTNFEFPLYPTLGDSSFFYERFTLTNWKVKGGLAYRLNESRFETGHQVYAQQEWGTFEKNLQDRPWSRLTLAAKGEIIHRPKPFEARFDYRLEQVNTNLFDPLALYEGTFTLSLPGERMDYARKEEGPDGYGQNPKDSVVVPVMRRPVSLFAGALRTGINPTFQQSYGGGWAGNNFVADTALRNQSLELYRLGMEWRGKDTKTKYGSLKGSRFGLTGFASTQRSPIVYDSSMVLRQFGDTTSMTFVGVEASGRFRFRSWSLEASVVAQTGSSANAYLEELFVQMQPSLYGKAGIYWEKHDLKTARAIRAGIEAWGFVDHRAPLFDVPSQQFYPQGRFEQPGYVRLDAFFSAQVKKAQVFLRMYHANEGVTLPGYFTTLFYPMWDRTFMVGVNWTFFD